MIFSNHGNNRLNKIRVEELLKRRLSVACRPVLNSDNNRTISDTFIAHSNVACLSSQKGYREFMKLKLVIS